MRKLLFRVAAIACLGAISGSVAAQSFTENFDDITLLPGNGWFMKNNSMPLGAQPSWFQGTPTNASPTPGPFNAFNGALNAYIAANYANTAGGTGTISNWVVTPNRTLRNGDVFQFYTRKALITVADYPDRLEVRMSTNGASTNVGATAIAVGDFTSLMLSINPDLLINVYPQMWTQYTVTISGLPAPTSGRLAFRYFVTNAGPTGANSDYIGIDNAVYTHYTCPALTVNPTTLSGGTWGQAYSQSLSQTGALGVPHFAITMGALPPGFTLSSGGTIAGASAFVGSFGFTVTVVDASGCSGSRPYSITIMPALPSAPTNVSASAGDAHVDVTWTASAFDGGGPISGYAATCTDGANNFSASGNLPLIAVNGLANGTAYTCAVAAINAAGTGPASAASNSVTPKGNQTITFDAQSAQTYNPDGTFAIDPPATASSGLVVSYGSSTPSVCTVSGASVSIVAVGTCTLTADQPGNNAWNAALQVSRSLVIAQASQTLTFPSQTTGTRWFKAGSTFAIAPQASSASPNSGEPILYSSLSQSVCDVSGTTVTMVAGGACVIAANQAGNDNFTPAAQATAQVMLVVPTEADLWVEKTADSATARIGDTVTYSILVGNDGQAAAANVRVLDVPPQRLDAASVAWQCLDAIGTVCPVPNAGTGALDITIASLPRDAAVRFELLGQVIPALVPEDDYTEFYNTASVALPQGSGLTDPAGNNQSTAGVLVVDVIFEDGFEPLPPQ